MENVSELLDKITGDFLRLQYFRRAQSGRLRGVQEPGERKPLPDRSAIDALVKLAIKSGDIRKDIVPFDLLRVIYGT